MLRRLLPLVLVAGICLFFYLTIFQTFSWRNLPQSIGLGEEYGTETQEKGQWDDEAPNLKTRPQGVDGGAHKNGELKVPAVDSQSPYPVGKTKPPGSNYTKTLVMARLSNENAHWVDNQLGDMLDDGSLSKAIYVVDDRTAPLHPPKNKGHEVVVYLSYIIDFYDKLPDVSMFMHAHRFAWHNNELLDTDAALMVRHLSPQRVTREGYMNLRCHWDPGCPAHIHPGSIDRDYAKQEEHILAESWAQMFPLDPIPTVLAQPCCAQFAVSKERILALPRSRYVFLRDWILRTNFSDYLSGRVFEYVWQFIFTASPIHCPSMSACYCDGYGLCFGSPEQFDYFFELRYNRNEYEDELRLWNEKAKLIELLRAQSRDGKIGEEDMLEVPEVGKDVELQRNIKTIGQEMKKLRREALERGQDPRQRALESGREWHDGDGL